MDDHTSEFVVNLAKTLTSEVQQFPGWKNAYVRFQATEGHTRVSASFADDAGVNLLGALRHSAMYDKMQLLFEGLHEATARNGNKFVACLLSVNSQLDYKILFERNDPNKWHITKMDGASGIPVGIEP